MRGLPSAAVAALVLAGALACLHAVTTPAFWPVDEIAHVAYADLLADGRLPTINSPIPRADYPGLGERLAFERATRYHDRLDVWTANHPPLAYLLAAAPLAAGKTVGLPGVGFVAARLLSVAAAVAGVWGTWRLARLLLPGRPRAWATAAGLAALTPGLAHFGGLVFNDVLGFALATWTLVAGLEVLRSGPSWSGLGLTAAVGAAAALTRVSCLPAVGLAVVACAVGVWQRHRGPVAARWRAAVGAAVLTGGVPAMAAGWFYVRNLLLYGDVTGSGALLDKFGRVPHDSTWGVVTDVEFWVRQWDRLLSDLATGVWAQGWPVGLGRVVGGLVLAGVVFHLLRRRNAGRRLSGAVAARLRLARVLAAALPLSLMVAGARFFAAGGSQHGRYLLTGLGVLAVGGAAALDESPGAARGWPQRVAAVLLAMIAADLWWRMLHNGADEWARAGIRLFLPRPAGSGSAAVAVVLLAVAAGAAGVWLRDLTAVQSRPAIPAARGTGRVTRPRPARGVRSPAAR